MVQNVSTESSETLRILKSKKQTVKDFFKQLFFKNPPAVPDEPAIELSGPVSVVIPALNEAARIAEVVRYALSDAMTGEVIVIDDSSVDDTAHLAREAGATVITSSMLGKGVSMRDGAKAAQYDVVVYLDGDLTGLQPNIITDLATPILAGQADFVKGQFGRRAGRVTELTAKPMLKLFFPELSEFTQPLGGIIAARRSLLEQMIFEDGYGVDIGLLIDAHLSGAHLMQVQIGSLEHDSQSLQGLSLMAQEISRVILERAKSVGRLSADQIMSIFELEYQNQTDIVRVLNKLEGCTKLVLLDMDGTITTERFVSELAKATGKTDQLSALLGSENIDAATRSQDIAALFRFVHKSQFEQVAHTIPIRDDIVQVVNALRRRGYIIGVVSDSYYVAAEIVRRRIFADFALAHTVGFDAGICQGNLSVNRAFYHADGCREHECCKSNVLRYIFEQEPVLQHGNVVAVGDNLNDLCLLKLAQRAFTIEPKHPKLSEASITEISHFSQLLTLLSPEQAMPEDMELRVV